MLWRLFIVALWSPAGKGLTSWLLLVMFIVFLLLSHVVSWVQVWYLIVSFPDLCRLPDFGYTTFSSFMIMESSLTIDDMINNPNLLLSAVNEAIASDTTQQYYTPQTPSTYISQPVQQMLQKQQSKTQFIEVKLKQIIELRSRVKNLEELSQQRAQQQTLEIPTIQIPIRLDIMTNDQYTTQSIGVGKATKKIKMIKKTR